MRFYCDAGPSWRPAFRRWLFCAALLGAAAGATAQSSLPAVRLQLGGQTVRVELADTPATLRDGLMHRTELAADSGMLFLLGPPDPLYCFWMKNTFLPLSIAFLADDGTIVNIERMAPQTESNHCPTQPVRFALEMNQGWFSEKGIKPGMRIAGLPQPR